MRNRQYKSPTELGISAKAATGAGNSINCTDFRHVTVSLGTASSGSMTIKVVGGIGDTAPNFGAAQSATNRYEFLDFALANNAGVITDGDTGVVFSGTDGNRLLSINTDGLDWVAVIVTAYAAGSVTADMSLFEN